MSLDPLRQLVRQYAANEIDYAAFRRLFVERFLAVEQSEGLSGLVHSIESACADHSEGYVNDAALKRRIARIAW